MNYQILELKVIKFVLYQLSLAESDPDDNFFNPDSYKTKQGTNFSFDNSELSEVINPSTGMKILKVLEAQNLIDDMRSHYFISFQQKDDLKALAVKIEFSLDDKGRQKVRDNQLNRDAIFDGLFAICKNPPAVIRLTKGIEQKWEVFERGKPQPFALLWFAADKYKSRKVKKGERLTLVASEIVSECLNNGTYCTYKPQEGTLKSYVQIVTSVLENIRRKVPFDKDEVWFDAENPDHLHFQSK